MSRLHLCALVAVAGCLAALAGVTARASAPGSALVRVAVARPGTYAVTVTIASSARSDVVELSLGSGSRRLVRTRRSRLTRVTEQLRVSAGLVVRAVGRPARPRLEVEVREVSTPAPSPQPTIANTGPPQAGSPPATSPPSGSPPSGNGPTAPAGAPPTASASSPVAATAPEPPYDTLVWSDEFNGPSGSPPDPADWRFDLGAWGADDNELETYTGAPANVSLDGQGHLAITALRQTLTGADGVTRGYTSARIETGGLLLLHLRPHRGAPARTGRTGPVAGVLARRR